MSTLALVETVPTNSDWPHLLGYEFRDFFVYLYTWYQYLLCHDNLESSHELTTKLLSYMISENPSQYDSLLVRYLYMYVSDSFNKER